MRTLKAISNSLIACCLTCGVAGWISLALGYTFWDHALMYKFGAFLGAIGMSFLVLAVIIRLLGKIAEWAVRYNWKLASSTSRIIISRGCYGWYVCDRLNHLYLHSDGEWRDHAYWFFEVADAEPLLLSQGMKYVVEP